MEADEPYYDDDDYDQEEELEEEEEVPEGEDPEADQWRKILEKHHPECRVDYIEDITTKLPAETINPGGEGKEGHRSPPFLTVYEKTKVIGFRATQLANGAAAYVPVPSHVTSVEEIARMELDARRLPYIIKRPMPDGTFEYWRLSDLMVL